MAARTLALFDFDGTITSKDTLFAFARFIHGDFRFLSGMTAIAPVLFMRALRVATAREAKERFLRKFIGNMQVGEFESHCARFATMVIPQLIRPLADQALRKHQQAGDRVIIISASAEAWIKPWAASRGLEVIGTRLLVKDGRLTGQLDGENCKGPEKVNRLQEVVELGQFGKIVAYGDSSGDREMFAISHEHHFKPFH